MYSHGALYNLSPETLRQEDFETEVRLNFIVRPYFNKQKQKANRKRERKYE